MEYALEADNLTKRYGKKTVLNQCTMRVPKGSVYGLIGDHGSGKTTLLRLICGLQGPTAGGYSIFGIRNTKKELEQVRRRMGAVVEAPALYRNMTAEENLRQQFLVRGLAPDGRIGDLLERVGLEAAGKKKVKHFSPEMCQRLGLAMAMAGLPDFLVLDDPARGLDQQRAREMGALIQKMNREHQVTCLLACQERDELARIATDYGVLERGRIVREMSAKDREAAGGDR